MAVLIEGINRPTEPRKCKFFDIDPLGVRKPFCAIQSVCDGLESCPLIEVPERNHGKWEVEIVSLAGITNGGAYEICGTYKIYRCSECKSAEIIASNYCPNCGAKMGVEC